MKIVTGVKNLNGNWINSAMKNRFSIKVSQGMILAASTDDDSVLSVVDPGDLLAGSIVR